MADPEQRNEANLEWRQPIWLFALFAWIFAGPLNPAVIPTALLMHGQAYAAMFLVGIPSALGVGVFLLRTHSKPMRLDQLAGRILMYALAMIPLYTALFVMIMLGENGLRSGGVVETLWRGSGGFFTGLMAGVVFGWVWLVFALPAAAGAVGVVRIIALRLKSNR